MSRRTTDESKVSEGFRFIDLNTLPLLYKTANSPVMDEKFGGS